MNIRYFIRIIRPVNLLIILFTQYMVRFAFLYPVYKISGFPLQLNEGVFAVFALAFVCMAAGGYIINDYYDVEIDKVNKPGKVIIGQYIKPSSAYNAYWILSLAGLAMGAWASHKAGLNSLSAVFIFYMAGLWFYSTTFKYMFVAGNLFVAVFLALVPLTSGIIELYADIKNPAFAMHGLSLKTNFYWLAGISLFAFLSAFSREIVKDIEDMQGDKAAGCRTLPVVLGKKAAVRSAQALLVIMFLLLAILQYRQWSGHNFIAFTYFSGFIQLPVLFIIFKLNRASVPPDFHKISNRLKILMVLGMCYFFVFAYQGLY